MALVPCRGCSRKVSDRAAACPHCGEPGKQHLTYSAFRSQSAPWFPLDNIPAPIMVAAVILLLTVSGLMMLAIFAMTSAPNESVFTSTGQQVTSRDGRVQITLPDHWVKIPPEGESMILFVGSEQHEAGVYIFAEDKDDLLHIDPRFHQLDDYSELVRSLLLRELVGGSEEAPVPTTVDGHPAVACSLHGTGDGVHYQFLQTVVETPSTFYQIRGFVAFDQFDAAQEELRQVMQSVRLNEP